MNLETLPPELREFIEAATARLAAVNAAVRYVVERMRKDGCDG